MSKSKQGAQGCATAENARGKGAVNAKATATDNAQPRKTENNRTDITAPEWWSVRTKQKHRHRPFTAHSSTAPTFADFAENGGKVIKSGGNVIKCFGVSKPFAIFAVPKLSDGYKPKKIFFAICTVVEAETPTRFH